MCAPTASCGWHSVFCLMWHTAASTFGSTCFFVQASEFGLAAMAEVVVALPATVLIGTASRFARGAAHVWRAMC